MASLDQLRADLLPSLPGVPTPLLRHHFARAAQEFCSRTKCWTEWTEPVLTIAGEREYEFELPSQAQVFLLERAQLDGRDIAVTSWRSYCAGEGASSRDLVTLTLPKRVGAGHELRSRVVLQPINDAASYPDALIAQYGAQIAYGAKAHLMLVPGASFANPDLAAANANLFESAISAATVREWRGRTQLTPRQVVQWL